MEDPVPIVILAGGLGARIGGNKPQKRLGGLSLLDHAITRAASYSSLIAASVSGGTLPFLDNIPQLQDDEKMHGPIAGLATALTFASSINASRVMIMPCDTPFLPDDLCQRLVDRIGTSLAAVAKYDGWLHPTCSLWRVEAASLLPDYIAKGRRSLIGFAEAVGLLAVEWPTEAVDPFFNINTTNDLLRAERIFADRQKTK